MSHATLGTHLYCLFLFAKSGNSNQEPPKRGLRACEAEEGRLHSLCLSDGGHGGTAGGQT